jgi:hypothetical protein
MDSIVVARFQGPVYLQGKVQILDLEDPVGTWQDISRKAEAPRNQSCMEIHKTGFVDRGSSKAEEGGIPVEDPDLPKAAAVLLLVQMEGVVDLTVSFQAED